MSKKLNHMIEEELKNLLGESPDINIPDALQRATNPSRVAAAKAVKTAGNVYDKYGVASTLKRGGEEVIDLAKQSLATPIEIMVKEEFDSLLNETVDTDPDADADADFSATAEVPPKGPGIRVKVPQSEEPSIRDAIKYIMQRGAPTSRSIRSPGVVENITWTDVQNALRTGIEKTGATPLIRKGAEAVMTAAEHDPTGIIDKSFRGGQMIGKYGPGALADEAPSATLRATGQGLQAAGQEAGKVEDYWKQGIGPGLQRGGQEMVVAADGLNESQDPFKRMSELALKSYGTCKYED